MQVYRMETDGFLMAIDKLIAELPFPLSEVIESRYVLMNVLKISIGYQDRTRLLDTDLGINLYQSGLVPYAITKFIQSAVLAVEELLLQYLNLRLHYSEHSYELGQSLVIYKTAAIKPNTVVVGRGEMTAYHARLLREQEEQRERDEAYAIEDSRTPQSFHYSRGTHF